MITVFSERVMEEKIGKDNAWVIGDPDGTLWLPD